MCEVTTTTHSKGLMMKTFTDYTNFTKLSLLRIPTDDQWLHKVVWAWWASLTTILSATMVTTTNQLVSFVPFTTPNLEFVSK